MNEDTHDADVNRSSNFKELNEDTHDADVNRSSNFKELNENNMNGWMVPRVARAAVGNAHMAGAPRLPTLFGTDRRPFPAHAGNPFRQMHVTPSGTAM